MCVSECRNGIVATIIDLGLTKPIGSESVYPVTFNINRLPWIAPEFLTHTHPSSEWSDVYSLAFMMQGLLSLRRGSVSQHVDAGLMQWINAALQHHPAHRPTLMSLVVVLQGIIEAAGKQYRRW